MVSNKISLAIVFLVGLSIGIGIYILATDDHIYEHAPSHAYGLMTFVAVYATLLGLLKFRNNMAKTGILIMATVQFVAMNLDILTTENIPIFHVRGLEFNELLEHLYGSWYFDLLLGVQAALIGLSVVSIRYETTPVIRKSIRRKYSVFAGIFAVILVLLIAYPSMTGMTTVGSQSQQKTLEVGTTTPSGSSSQGSSLEMTATTPSGVKVTLSWTPATIEPGKQITFTLKFFDKTGNQINDAQYDFMLIREGAHIVHRSLQTIAQGASLEKYTFKQDQTGSVTLRLQNINLTSGEDVEFSLQVVS